MISEISGLEISTPLARTFILQDAVFSPSLVFAVIELSPSVIAVTIPCSSTDTTLLSLELHVTLLSVAVLGSIITFNCKCSPATILASVSSSETPVTLIILSVTVTRHFAVFLPLSAVTVMILSPKSTAETIPVSSTDAILGALELHV